MLYMLQYAIAMHGSDVENHFYTFINKTVKSNLYRFNSVNINYIR